MKKLFLVMLHSLPFVLGILCAYFLWHSNITLCLLYIAITAVFIMTGKDKKAEAFIALYGLIAAFIIETIGTQISGYQTFNNPTIGGIPIWLPVSFSYGFVLMKRIGMIISTGSPWSPKVNNK